jgi:hypothetical protein
VDAVDAAVVAAAVVGVAAVAAVARRLRWRLRRLRRLWLWLWLLPFMGRLRHLLKGSNPKHNKSPSQHCAIGRGPTVLAVPTERGQLVFAPMLSASQ